MLIWEIAVMSAAGAVMLTAITKKLMQILQLSSYRPRGVFAWLKRTKFDYMVRYFALAFFCFTSMFVFVMCFDGAGKPYSYLGILFFVFLTAYFCYAVSKESKKTPLKVTKRIVRLSVVDFIYNYGLSFLLIWALSNTVLRYSLLGIAPLLSLPMLLLAHYTILPVEKLIGHGYIVKAKKKLEANHPIVIGITGSYGKTTAKNILSVMLREKYKVFASPASFNTPMGLCKCINEEYKGEEIFIAEMGARFSGDIAYLCKIFHPKYAMVTSVGNMHLETFGSIEKIVKEKLSVYRGVEYAVGNGDCPLIAENVDSSVHLSGADGEAAYSNVHSTLLGTSFTLKVGGETFDVHTRLVGEHIPSSIAMCALMANKLGISPDRIAAATEKLPFTEHRLEVLNSGDIIILDDSYNSNPAGAENALAILDTFEGRKVVITPGFVELGADSSKCLLELGAQIASVCDYAFLLGPNAEEIKRGMGDFANAEIVSDLGEAMEKLKSIETPMAVLFENDLPDNY